MNYRVEIDGKIVWEADIAGEVTTKHLPEQYRARPAETPDGEAHGTPVYLYIGDELVGIQRSHGDEADTLDAAADECDDVVEALALRAAALDARAYAAEALGNKVAAAEYRLEHARLTAGA